MPMREPLSIRLESRLELLEATRNDLRKASLTEKWAQGLANMSKLNSSMVIL